MSTSDASRTATVDPAALRDDLAGGQPRRLLDVRTPSEFETGHIPGAYNVPLDLLREHRGELRSHLDDDVVLICRSGNRAAQAERALAEAGLLNLRILAGGMLAWQAAGGPVNGGQPRWDLERQVRLVAGTVVLVSVAGSVFLPGLQWIAAALGVGLAGAALTNTCMMGAALAKLPYNRGPGCDFDKVVAQLAAGSRST